MKKKRMIFGIIAAEADNVEQRQLLEGIINQAQSLNIDIAIFSNIYNPNVPNAEFGCENKIYDLIRSPEIDALILISESILNVELRETIKQHILSRTDIPIIIIGTSIPAFSFPNCRFINTSDENDLTDITDHLIEIHGFKKIDILTGYSYLDASNLRINGYRKSLEKHGISFDESRVHFGDFWMTSGQALAQQYIKGELPFPEAVICANDYMAYGMLDELLDNGICVPDNLTVVGYENVNKRLLHSPLLTTYQRNRKTVGMEAVKILYSKITSGIDLPFFPPKGTIIQGSSCGCGVNTNELNRELKNARIIRDYEFSNIYSQMEHRLTECSSMDDFIRVCGNFQHLIRDAHDILLCLSDNWNYSMQENNNDIMHCRSIVPWKSDAPKINYNKYQLSAICNTHNEAAAYYFTPLFFSNKLFGYIVLRFDFPDTYDLIFRSWIKSVSNALEMLRMKNDIQYLSQCQDLSETRDSLSGLYNKKGLEQEVRIALHNASPEHSLIMLMIRTNIMSGELNMSQSNTKEKINTTIELAEAVKRLVTNKNEFCGRIDDNTFIFAGVGSYSPEYESILLDRFQTLILHSDNYRRLYGINSFVCAKLAVPAENADYYSNIQTLEHDIQISTEKLSSKLTLPNYDKYAHIRNEIYLNPKKNLSAQDVSQRLYVSYGHFRATYKTYFDVSYHQDCIMSKISLAKHLLLTSTMSISSIANCCGYDDDKYFMHQFRQYTNCTPNQYRSCRHNSV